MPSIKNQRIAYGELIFILAMMTSLGALTIDLQLLAMPMILQSFGLNDTNQQQWIITAYMFGFAAAQILYGPISDSLGRKPVLLFGLTVYVLASMACLIADSYWLFLAARAFQGVGAASARIMVNAITRDFFQGNEMAKVTSLVMLIFIMVPVFAPTLGSGILYFGQWHLILWVYMVFGTVVMMWSALRLPESLSDENKKPLRFSRIKSSFKQVVSQPLSMSFAVISGVVFAGFMAYLNAAEQIYSQIYGAKEQFPYLFGGIALFFGLAAFVNSKVVMRFGAMQVTFYGMLVLTWVNFLNLILSYAFGGVPPLWLFVMMMACTNVCIGLAYGNLMAIAMLPLGQVAGMGASVIGAISAIMAAAIGIFISQQLRVTVMPIIVGFFITSLIAFGLVFRFRKHKNEDLAELVSA